MTPASLVDLAPLAPMVVLCSLLALLPMAWIAWRHRHGAPGTRWRALTVLTLFLTFDLVLFGAFTRLTDSGLGCPDWPGCYGNASPFGAHHEINAAQQAEPAGPVTHRKAWIEMIHRYLASTVGVLITVSAVAAWWFARSGRRAAASPWWATATLAWVCLQGAFGALTVTMKLYPAIVTLHLLGGLGLLALLALQVESHQRRPLAVSPGLARACWAVLALVALQAALGAWVSTNYAVLACTDVPTCHGSWWPEMDFRNGFALLRPLGVGADGRPLTLEALTAIHFVHRVGAVVVLSALGGLAWRLARTGLPAARRWAWALGLVGAWQLVTGLSNIVLGWPLAAAVSHTGGAAAAVTLLTMLSLRAREAQTPRLRLVPAARGSGRAADAAS